jgi:hypothetical protein
MPTHHTKNKLKKAWQYVQLAIFEWWPGPGVARRVLITLLIILGVVVGGMYGIARWYIWSGRNTATTVGVTFIPDYAQSLGVSPQETMKAIVDDLHVKQFRLVSYWSDMESRPGKYDFSQLDWQFKEANAAHAKVSLAIGLRQPRWPECHAPSWADTSQPATKWQPQLEAFMTKVIQRYKNNPALDSYQLENEYFNHFGDCYNFDRSRLSDELALVHKTDPHHPIIMSRSNNYIGLMLKQPLPDIIGISVYRRVWDGEVSHRYFQYPYPAWYYAFLAGAEKIITGKDSVLHELQAEPWPSNGKTIQQISLDEQNKSFDAQQLTDRVNFGKATGMKTIDLWGAEYWYYRMIVLHDPSVWNAAKQSLAND